MKYILNDSRCGYFKKWTGIGPMCTPNKEEAMVFETEQEAKQHPAYVFSMTDFKPEPLQ